MILFIIFPYIIFYLTSGIFGGAHGVTVIIVEMDLANWVQIFDKPVYISYSTKNLGMGINQTILLPVMGK